MTNTLINQVRELQDSARTMDARELLQWLDGRGWLAPFDAVEITALADEALMIRRGQGASNAN